MAQSAVQICNMALSRIGVSKPIASLDEASNEARQCSLWYEQCRDEVLQAYPWKFARKVAALQETGDAHPGWEYSFAYPNDCLTTLKLTDDAGDRIATSATSSLLKIAYDVVASSAGKLIVCDQTGLYLHYTSRVESPAQFTPLFMSALAWRLAAELATPLAAKPDISAKAFESYMGVINEAVAHSLNEGYEGAENTTDLITGRF